MTYFKINDIDFSMYVNQLKVQKEAKYNAQTNAAGNTVVDLVNAKRVIEVGIIPLTEEAMIELQNEIDKFNISISFMNPTTNTLAENVNCIVPTNGVEYYTLSGAGRAFKAFNIKFIEL